MLRTQRAGRMMTKTAQAIILGVVVALVVSIGMGVLLSLNGIDPGGLATITGAGAGVFSAYIFGNLAGNRRIANAGEAEKRATLDREPPAERAVLFIYREGFVAKLAGLNIVVDGQPVAQLKSPRFTAVVVGAGSHTVSAGFGGLAGAQSKPGECTIEAPPGGRAAVRIGIAMGALKGGVALTPQTDLAAVRARLLGMPMTPPDLAEL